MCGLKLKAQAGETAQSTAALEDLGLVLSTHMVAITIFNSCSRASVTFLWPPWALHTCRQTLTHKKNLFKKGLLIEPLGITQMSDFCHHV